MANHLINSKISTFNGYFNRMWVYIKEMYPIHKRLPLAAILFLSINFIVQSLMGITYSIFNIHTLFGSISVFLILFILRLMDELKDVEIDKRLFAHRPIPSGKVSEKDIKLSLNLMIFLFLSLNLWDSVVFISSFILLSYTLLMYKYFFIPHILRDNLLLNLITHNPVVAIIMCYIIIISFRDFDIDIQDDMLFNLVILVLMYWGIFFSWEISRKIRAKEDENEYVTYSQIFGLNAAVIITIFTQTVVFVLGILLYHLCDFSIVYLIFIVLAYFISLALNLRFIVKPISSYSNLGKYTETFALLTMSAPIIDYSLRILE